MQPIEFDVIVVGAGLSGIGAGVHLTRNCPGKTFAILEGRERMGGTWDLFRYPGIRSDSDMFTLGYAFKPWTNPKAIADGPSILEYIRDTAREHRVDEHIRYQRMVRRARWSEARARWTLEVEHEGRTETYVCSFLLVCAGYYDYAEGYTPEFPGRERFAGTVVHPQQWPEGLDHAGKRVVVIGSGATAVTLVPELAKTAAKVTMLQRSPTYVLSAPEKDALANYLRAKLGPEAAYDVARWKNILVSMAFYNASRRWPAQIKKLILGGVKKQLKGALPIAPHFTPSYAPWDQRVCLVPDADLFRAVREGRATIVTDHIETFTEKGIRLKSGQELEADIIVTATGLKLKALGGIEGWVDGKKLEPKDMLTYKGVMVSDVPNLAFVVGYTNASWTLKADLACEYVCRLLNHMDAHGYTHATPRRTDPDVEERPLIDFSSGYIQRAIDQFPRQGNKAPWRLYQNYVLDRFTMRQGPIDDGTLELARAAAPRASASPALQPA